MPLTDKQLERYSRHINVHEFGVEGQEKLINSKVLVIGTGALGSPAIMYLAAAGIGTLGLCDADTVDFSNLQRQIIHHTADVGKLKTSSALEKVNAINPEVKVNIHNALVNDANIDGIISGYDFVLDCTDNFEAKFLINDECVRNNKPFCHGAVIRFSGQAMTYVPGKGPCYRCVFGEPPKKDSLPANRSLGVLGPLPGIIGSLQALECIKYLTGTGELLVGRIFTLDGLTMQSKVRVLPLNEDCPVCGTLRQAGQR